MSNERHMVITGYTIDDTGHSVSITWHCHCSQSEQTTKRFAMCGTFTRAGVRYTVWSSKFIDRVPSREACIEIVRDHYQSIINPWGAMHD